MAVRLSIVLFCSGTADLQLWLRETYKAGSQGEQIAKGGLQLFENLGHNWLAVLNGRLPWSWIPPKQKWIPSKSKAVFVSVLVILPKTTVFLCHRPERLILQCHYVLSILIEKGFILGMTFV